MISESQALAALPDRGWLRRYVEYATSITDANAAYHIAAGLSVLSQTVPISFLIPDGKIRANFYAMIVGGSTKSRKTTAVKIASSILTMAAPDRIMPMPGSEERFVDSLVENPQQILFVQEGGPFFSSMESGYRRVLKDRITEVYDCGRLARETVGNRKRVYQDNPRFSILIGISDAYLEGHTSDEDWMSGMLARFFTVYAQRERTRKMVGSNKTEELALAEILKDYISFAVRFAGSGDVFAPRFTECKGFDEEANELWSRWFDEKEASQRGSRTVEATIERSQDMAWKIAGLLAWDYGQARSGSDWYITADCLKPALAITELHIQSAITIGDTLSTDRDMRVLRRVYQAIGNDPTPISTIFRAAQVTSRYGNEMIKTLMEHRRIELAPANGTERMFTRTSDAEVTWRINGSNGIAKLPAAAVMIDIGNGGDLFGGGQTPVTEAVAKSIGDLFGET